MLRCLTLLLLSGSKLDSAGIYLTAADFQHRHLAYATIDQQLHQAFPSTLNIIKVHTPAGRQLRFAADSIYGYHKGGQDFRFISSKTASISKSHTERFMAIQATAPVCVYSYSVAIRFGSITYWFYSIKPDTPVRQLTAKSLAKDFPNKPALAQEVSQDKKLRYSMATRDDDGQLRVVKIIAKYLP